MFQFLAYGIRNHPRDVLNYKSPHRTGPVLISKFHNQIVQNLIKSGARFRITEQIESVCRDVTNYMLCDNWPTVSTKLELDTGDPPICVGARRCYGHISEVNLKHTMFYIELHRRRVINRTRIMSARAAVVPSQHDNQNEFRLTECRACV